MTSGYVNNPWQQIGAPLPSPDVNLATPSTAPILNASESAVARSLATAYGTTTVGIAGDSLAFYGVNPGPAINSSVTIPGINLSAGYCSMECSMAGAATFEYRGASREVRFAAFGDSAGPWVPITTSKRYVIPSNDPTMTVDVAIFVGRLTAANATSSLTYPAPPTYTGLLQRNFPTWLQIFSGQSLKVVNAAAPGAVMADLDGIIDDLRDRQLSAGVMFSEVWIQIGTNEVSAGTNPDVPALMTQLGNSLSRAKNYGWKVRVFSLPMRDLAAGSTAQSGWRAYNKALPELCLSAGVAFHDIWAHTNDPASAIIPTAGLTTDNIHPSGPGAFYTALSAWNQFASQLVAQGGAMPLFASTVDVYNAGTNPTGNLVPGTPVGSAGTAGGGGTNTDVATGWDVRRNTGAITIVGDKINLLDGGPPWQRLTFGAAAAITDEAKYEYNLGVGSNQISAGDIVEAFVELNVPATAGIRRLAIWLTMVGTARNDSSIWDNFDTGGTFPDFPAVAWPGRPVIYLPKIKATSGITSMRFRVFVQTAIGATPVFYLRRVLWRKVAA